MRDIVKGLLETKVSPGYPLSPCLLTPAKVRFMMHNSINTTGTLPQYIIFTHMSANVTLYYSFYHLA